MLCVSLLHEQNKRRYFDFSTKGGEGGGGGCEESEGYDRLNDVLKITV